MSKKNVILFGNMYSGKSTIAAALCDMGYTKLSFSSALKNFASLAYGTIDKSQYYPVTDKTGRCEMITGRQLLQNMGQIVKEVDKEFWLKCTMRDARNYLDQPLVIDDGRFIFEFLNMKNAGWFTVGINTPYDKRMERAVKVNGRVPTESEINHESENELSNIMLSVDMVLTGLEDPYEEAAKIMKAMNA